MINWVDGTRGPDIDINEKAFSAMRQERQPRTQTEKHGPSLEKRKAVFWDTVLAEDRAEREATRRLGEPRTVDDTKHWHRLYMELRKKHLRAVAEKHGVSDEKARKITIEGIRNKWPTPSRGGR